MIARSVSTCFSTSLTLVLLLGLAGCSDDPKGEPVPADLVDEMQADTAVDGTLDTELPDTARPDTSQPDTTADTEVADTPVEDAPIDLVVTTAPPGSACNCDADCEGDATHAAICVFGICMTTPTTACSAGGSTAECPAGSQCWGMQGITGQMCWPDCASFTCAGTCDGDGSCAPDDQTSCSSACGAFCSTTASGDMGAPCLDDSDCGSTGTCYLDVGWLDGYCLEFGCATGGAACGSNGLCVAGLSSDGANVCMGACTDGCRQGYECSELGGTQFCSAGCTKTSDCPAGHLCEGNVCIVDLSCSPTRPLTGECPVGQMCDAAGQCVPFVCGTPTLEPNETQATAALVSQSEPGLQLCAGDQDWFTFSPTTADTLYVVGTHSYYASGNLDNELVLADGTVHERSRLIPGDYHDENPVGPMDRELLSIVGAPTAADLSLHVFGVSNAVNNYDLELVQRPWKDGATCEAAGFTSSECRATTSTGAPQPSAYLPFPAGHAADPLLGDQVFFASALVNSSGVPGYVTSTSRTSRRELAMAIRWAISVVEAEYPGTTPLGVGEISMPDGTTPWGHPNHTHDYGSNADIAYYVLPQYQRQWGNMVYRQICNDAATLNDWSAVGTSTTGTCIAGSENTHIVDIPRTALFLATLASTGRVRVFGVDTAVEADLDAEYLRLRNAGTISTAAYNAVVARQATANDHSSWVWHFNHTHVSFCYGDLSDC